MSARQILLAALAATSLVPLAVAVPTPEGGSYKKPKAPCPKPGGPGFGPAPPPVAPLPLSSSPSLPPQPIPTLPDAPLSPFQAAGIDTESMETPTTEESLPTPTMIPTDTETESMEAPTTEEPLPTPTMTPTDTETESMEAPTTEEPLPTPTMTPTDTETESMEPLTTEEPLPVSIPSPPPEASNPEGPDDGYIDGDDDGNNDGNDDGNNNGNNNGNDGGNDDGNDNGNDDGNDDDDDDDDDDDNNKGFFIPLPILPDILGNVVANVHTQVSAFKATAPQASNPDNGPAPAPAVETTSSTPLPPPSPSLPSPTLPAVPRVEADVPRQVQVPIKAAAAQDPPAYSSPAPAPEEAPIKAAAVQDPPAYSSPAPAPPIKAAAAVAQAPLPHSYASRSSALDQPPPITCHSGVYIIVGRGSTEDPGEGKPGAVADIVKSRIPDSASVAVDYPASLTDPDYTDSVTIGIVDTIAKIHAYVDACKDNGKGKDGSKDLRIALIGYSQGGHVMTDVLAGEEDKPGPLTDVLAGEEDKPGPLTEEYSRYITAVTVFGDPTFTKEKSWNVGNSTNDGIFARPGTSLDLLSKFSSKIQSYCLEDDMVCASGNSQETHTSEVATWTQAAADFIVKQNS